MRTRRATISLGYLKTCSGLPWGFSWERGCPAPTPFLTAGRSGPAPSACNANVQTFKRKGCTAYSSHSLGPLGACMATQCQLYGSTDNPAHGVLPTYSHFIPSTTASHASPAIRLRSSAVAKFPAIRSASSSNPPSTTTAEAPAWRCWVAMASQVARCPARSRAISPRRPTARDSASAALISRSVYFSSAFLSASSATAWRRCSSVLAWAAARRSRSATCRR